MNGLSNADPEAFIRELMHGEKAQFKRGYTAENAALAAQDARGLSDEETELLAAYATGYADSIRTLTRPGYETLLEDEGDWSDAKRAAYERGQAHGLNADIETIVLG